MYLIPSAVTALTLLSGLFAMLGFREGYSILLVCALILMAFIFDALDGYLARKLNQTSKFGANLDSIADFVTFSFAPIYILFDLSKGVYPVWVNSMYVIYLMAAAMRLINFSHKSTVGVKDYFDGLPTPMAGCLLISLLLLGISPEKFPEFFILLIMNLSYLMVSKIKFPRIQKIVAPKFSFSLWCAGCLTIIVWAPLIFPLYLLASYLIWSLIHPYIQRFL